MNFADFCYKFEENFTEIDKIGDISKFEILNPKIQNLKSLTLKSKIFNFDKIWNITLPEDEDLDGAHLEPPHGVLVDAKTHLAAVHLHLMEEGLDDLLLLHELDVREHLEPTKFVILRIFLDKIWWFCENLDFGEIWNLKP